MKVINNIYQPSFYDKAYSLLPRQTGFKSSLIQSLKLCKEGYLVNSVAALNQAARKFLTGVTTLNFIGDRYWPENRHIYSPTYKFVYSSIPKVACTSFKRLVLSLEEGDQKAYSVKDIHLYISLNHTLSRLPLADAVSILNGNEYFKFAIVRNPWSRIVSAYLSKFVKPKSLEWFAKEVVDAVHLKKGIEPDYQQRITFRQFLDYLCESKDEDLNVHWKPQSCFLGDTKYDFIGKLENINRDFEYIRDRVGIPKELPKDLSEGRTPTKLKSNNQAALTLEPRSATFMHPLDVSPQEASETCHADMHPPAVKALSYYPNYQRFYTPDMVDMLADRYSKDVARLCYTFDPK